VPEPGASAPRLSQLVPVSGDNRNATAILVQLDGDVINATRFQRTSDRTYLGARHLMWLGHADTRESLSRLRTMMNGGSLPVMKELAAAYPIHADRNLVIPSIESLLASSLDSDVKTEALQWLARLHNEDPRVV
jgi:hypothetical protein